MYALFQHCIYLLTSIDVLPSKSSVKRYLQSKIGTVFQFGIVVRLQYFVNWQFSIHNAP